MDEYYECSKCGCTMEKMDEEILICPVCHYSIEIEDYGTDDDYDEYYPHIPTDIPCGCEACGGPWPYCCDSCNLYDD